MKKPRRVCCVCGLVVESGDAPEPISHTYCEDCGKKLEEQISKFDSKCPGNGKKVVTFIARCPK